MANGVAAVRQVIAADSGVTALVPTTRIIADDVLPQDTALPAILVKHVSGIDMNIPNPSSTVFVTQRVQVEIYAADNPSRQEVKKAVRQAVRDNRFPTVAGITSVTIHTEAEGPDFFSEDPYVRIGEQDFKVTFNETS